MVEALSLWRIRTGIGHGEKLVKNVLVDLGVKKSRALIEVYEVKTSCVRGDIYTAIGRLTVHAAEKGCRRIMVLPTGPHLPTDIAETCDAKTLRLCATSLRQRRPGYWRDTRLLPRWLGGFCLSGGPTKVLLSCDPRIEEWHFCVLKLGRIAGYDCQAMLGGSCSDDEIRLRKRMASLSAFFD